MKARQTRLVLLAVLAAVVIAVALRDVVEQLIIQPLAYFLWSLGVMYRFIPQPILWLVLVVGMVYLTFGSFAGKFEWPMLRRGRIRPRMGPVEELARQIEHREDGIYFKWQIARTLGEIAADLQEMARPVRRRKLDVESISAAPEVRRYLDAGMHTSFSDYPLPDGLPLLERLPFSEKLIDIPSTPFDMDIDPVIAYLESRMENDDDFRRP